MMQTISNLLSSLMPSTLSNAVMILIAAVITFVVLLINLLVVIYFERKVLGDAQMRLSIMRVGKHGVLQPIADLLKFILKEDIIPRKADRFLFILSPLLFFIPSIMLYLNIPISQNFVAINIELGLFYFFAILTIMPIGMILAGWASNSKYSLIGGLRAAAQQISYEIPLLLATLGVIMIAGSLNLTQIVNDQQGLITIFGVTTFVPNWFIFYQPFGFVLFYIGVLADLQRGPFDLPEAEQEIVAGPFTEYSSFKFSLFKFTEYAALIAMSAIVVVLYLGGWNGPLLPPFVWFLIKTYAVIWLAIWIRATLPRLRIDQLMNFGWKILLPLTLLNIVVTGLLIMQAGPK